MKYLKKFNEATGWSDYITKLVPLDFKLETIHKVFIDVSTSEIKYIKDKCPDLYSSFNIKCDKRDGKMSLLRFLSGHRCTDWFYQFWVYKTDDEWFYIICSDLDILRYGKTSPKEFSPAQLKDFKLFKCDQIDGVVRLIDEFIEHKNKNLKLSESINNRTPKQIAELLEDVFVEIFDKWEIKEIPVVDDGQFFANLETEDLYYKISTASFGKNTNKKTKVILQIKSNIFQPSSIERFKEMVRDCQPVLTRLKSFGIDFHWDSQMIQNPYNFGRLEYFRVVVELPNKVSESYHNDEINRDEYRELRGGAFDPELNKGLSFTNDEFETIKHFCFKLTSNSSIMTLDKKSITVFYRNTPRIMIEKFDDEWYVCKYIKENKYFKCDTFDGLLQELKRYLD